MNGLRTIGKMGGIGLIAAVVMGLVLGCESPVQNYTRDQSRSVASQDILNIQTFDVKTSGTEASIVQGRALINHDTASISFVAASAVLDAGKAAMAGEITYTNERDANGNPVHIHKDARGNPVDVHDTGNALIPEIGVQGAVVLPLTERYINYMFRSSHVNAAVRLWAELVKTDTGIGLNPAYIFELIDQQNATGVYIEPPPATFAELKAHCLTVDFTQPTNYIVLNVPKRQARRYRVTPAPYTARPIYVNGVSGNDDNDGSDWARAFATLDKALTAPNPNSNDAVPKTIWIAAGTYTVNGGIVVDAANSTIKMPGGLEILGGFSGIENAPYEPERNPVIIKNSTGPDAVTAANVLSIVERPVTIEAITVHGDGARRPVYIKGGSLTLKANAKLTGGGGTTITQGGGAFITGNGTLNIAGGEVVGNTATAAGGGVYVDSGEVFLTHGVSLDAQRHLGKINYNTVGTAATPNNTSKGGGVYVGFKAGGVPNGKFVFTNGEIKGNVCFGNGGGVYVDIHSTDATLCGTFLMGEGGATLPTDEWPIISGNIAYGDSANAGKGGGVYVKKLTSFTTWAAFVKQGVPAETRSGVIFGAENKAPNPLRVMADPTWNPGTTANIAGKEGPGSGAPGTTYTYTANTFDLVRTNLPNNGHAVFFEGSPGKDESIGNYIDVDSNNQEATSSGDPRIQDITVRYGDESTGRLMSVTVRQPYNGTSGYDENFPKVGLIKITLPADAIDLFGDSSGNYDTFTTIQVANSSLLLQVLEDFQGGSLAENGNLGCLFGAGIATRAGGYTAGVWNSGSPYFISGDDDSPITAQALANVYNGSSGYIAERIALGGIVLNDVISDVADNRAASSNPPTPPNPPTVGTGSSITGKKYNYGKAPWFVVLDATLTAYVYIVEVVLESGSPIYVDADASGSTLDGSNWGMAYETIADALADGRAQSGNPVEIWVQGGNGTAADVYDFAVPSTVRETVTIIGGFSGQELTKKSRTAIRNYVPTIKVDDSGMSVLNGSNITLLDVDVTMTSTPGPFTLGNGSTLTLGDGVTWKDIPIIANSSSKVTLNGIATQENLAATPPIIGDTPAVVEVSGADAANGSLQINSGSQLILTGASEIKGNANGYGVVLNAGTMTMAGVAIGTTPTYQAPKVYGNKGGIRVTEYSSLTITDADITGGRYGENDPINYTVIPQIYGNTVAASGTAGGQGGGIYVDKSSVVMNGGVIRDNTATGTTDGDVHTNLTGNGGGIFLGQNAIFTMQRGHIRHNSAIVGSGGPPLLSTGNGGGIYLRGGTITTAGSAVKTSNNSGTKFIFTGSDDDTLVFENSAARGGGAYIGAGSIIVRGGTKGKIYGSGSKTADAVEPYINYASQSGVALYDENGDPNIGARTVSGGPKSRLEAGGIAVTAHIEGSQNTNGSTSWGVGAVGEFNTLLPPPKGNSWDNTTNNEYAKAADKNEITEFKLGSVLGTIIHEYQTKADGSLEPTADASEIQIDISLSAIQNAPDGSLDAVAKLMDGNDDLFNSTASAAKAYMILPLAHTDYVAPNTYTQNESYSGIRGEYYQNATMAANDAFPAPANGNLVYVELMKQGIVANNGETTPGTTGANMVLINAEAAKSLKIANKDLSPSNSVADSHRLLYTAGDSLGKLKFQAQAQKNVIVFYVVSQKGRIRQYRLVVNVFTSKPIHVGKADGTNVQGNNIGDTWNTGTHGMTILGGAKITDLYDSPTSQDVWIKHDANGYTDINDGLKGGTINENNYDDASNNPFINGATLTFTGNFVGTETLLDARPNINTGDTNNPKGQTKINIKGGLDNVHKLYIVNYAKVTFRELDITGDIYVQTGSQLILENTLVRGQIVVTGNSLLTIRDSAINGKTSGTGAGPSYGMWAGVENSKNVTGPVEAVILGKNNDPNDSSQLNLTHGTIKSKNESSGSGDRAVAVQLFGSSEFTMYSTGRDDTGSVPRSGETGLDYTNGTYRSRIEVESNAAAASNGVELSNNNLVMHNTKFTLHDGIIYDNGHGIGAGVYVGGTKHANRPRSFFHMVGGKIAGFNGVSTPPLPAEGGAGVKIEAGGSFYKASAVDPTDTNTSVIRGNSYQTAERNTSAVVDYALSERGKVSITGDLTNNPTDPSGFIGGNSANAYAYYTQEFGSVAVAKVNLVSADTSPDYPAKYPLLARFVHANNGTTPSPSTQIVDGDKYLYFEFGSQSNTPLATFNSSLDATCFVVYGQPSASLETGSQISVKDNGVVLMFNNTLAQTTDSISATTGHETNIIITKSAIASQDNAATVDYLKSGAYTVYGKIVANDLKLGDKYAYVKLSNGSFASTVIEALNWRLIQQGGDSELNHTASTETNKEIIKMSTDEVRISYGNSGTTRIGLSATTDLHILATAKAASGGNFGTGSTAPSSWFASGQLAGAGISTAGDKNLVVTLASNSSFDASGVTDASNWKIVHEGWTTTAAEPSGAVDMDDKNALLTTTGALVAEKAVYVFAHKDAVSAGDINPSPTEGVRAFWVKQEIAAAVDDMYIYAPITGGMYATTLSSTGFVPFQKGAQNTLTVAGATDFVRIEDTKLSLKLNYALSNTNTFYLLVKANQFVGVTAPTTSSFKLYYGYKALSDATQRNPLGSETVMIRIRPHSNYGFASPIGTNNFEFLASSLSGNYWVNSGWDVDTDNYLYKTLASGEANVAGLFYYLFVTKNAFRSVSSTSSHQSSCLDTIVSSIQ